MPLIAAKVELMLAAGVSYFALGGNAARPWKSSWNSGQERDRLFSALIGSHITMTSV